MTTPHAATMTINGVALQVQCLLPTASRDAACPDLAARPEIAALDTWDAAAVEQRANAIAKEFCCRPGDMDDAAWCLSKMDADSGFSRLYRRAKTVEEWEDEQSNARRACLRGDLT